MTLPHYSYAEAVATVEGGDGPYDPDEWAAGSDGGLLFAAFYYRRGVTAGEPVPGSPHPAHRAAARWVTGGRGCRRRVMLPPVADPALWPYGIALSWDSVDGWAWAELVNEWSEVDDHWVPLAVPVLASPASIRQIVASLFTNGASRPETASEEWAPHRQEPSADWLSVGCLTGGTARAIEVWRSPQTARPLRLALFTS
ncbi:hypothetical protein OHV05_36590 (plasmid) [Kitasatospora sp. NBC_00070]|uniref:hypothetical protein n=1 Tax=Kitasatospora sp. NBC_00070 TaxID=2975962 RepID=UPI002F91672A